jgi:hypothetical protein
MREVAPKNFPDEQPTKKTEDVPSRVIVLASRIDRLVEQAIGRLLSCPGDAELTAAVGNLQEVRALTGAVLR